MYSVARRYGSAGPSTALRYPNASRPEYTAHVIASRRYGGAAVTLIEPAYERIESADDTTGGIHRPGPRRARPVQPGDRRGRPDLLLGHGRDRPGDRDDPRGHRGADGAGAGQPRRRARRGRRF